MTGAVIAPGARRRRAPAPHYPPHRLACEWSARPVHSPDSGPHPHPQLLDHRPHRPREIYARGSYPRGDRRGLGARDVRAVPRRHGARARARHHHQGALGPPRLPRARRPGLRPQPDRHARPRRLHLRGLAQPGRLRGRHPGGRRLAGRAGADARQRLPGARPRPRRRAGHQQDRPAERRARAGAPADRGDDRPRRLARHPDQCQGGHRHRRRPGSHRARHPPAAGRPRRPRDRAHLRLVVRPLPRRGRAGARLRRPAREGPAHPHDGDREGIPRDVGRRARAARGRGRRARPGRGWHPHGGHHRSPASSR